MKLASILRGLGCRFINIRWNKGMQAVRQAVVEAMEPRQLLSTINVTGTSSADTFVVGLSAVDTNIVEVSRNGSLYDSKPVAEVTSITISGGSGDDTLTVDFGRGNPFGANVLSFAGGSGTDDKLIIAGQSSYNGSYVPSGTTLGDGIAIVNAQTFSFTGVDKLTADTLHAIWLVLPNVTDSITVDTASGLTRASGTSGGVGFAPLCFTNLTRLVIDGSTNDTTGGNDTLQITDNASPDTLLWFKGGAGANTITATASSTRLRADVSGSGVNALTVQNSAFVQLPITQTLGATSISNSGTIKFATVDPNTDGGQLLTVQTLSISSGGTLDLSRNNLLVNSGSVSAIRSLIVAGRNGGGWDGTGITSSASQISEMVPAYGGGPTAGSVSVLYRYPGDANRDGSVDSVDFDSWDQNKTNPGNWSEGDWDYDGDVDDDDGGLWADNFSGAVGGQQLRLSGSDAIQEDHTYHLSILGSNIAEWLVFWDDPDDEVTGVSPWNNTEKTHDYARDGHYRLVAVGKNSKGVYCAEVKEIDVTHAGEDIAVTGSSTVMEHQNYYLTLGQGNDPIASWSVDWGARPWLLVEHGL